MEGLVAPVIAGIVGANVGALILGELNLGLLGNTVAGIVAGILLVAAGHWIGLDVSGMAMLQKLALSGSAGAIAMAVAGFAYNRLI